ncbi:MAG: hypothetical protein P8J27_12665 [Mariniblastus sp.]|nr:hypothetical protein [Mariniblastus sp.]
MSATIEAPDYRGPEEYLQGLISRCFAGRNEVRGRSATDLSIRIHSQLPPSPANGYITLLTANLNETPNLSIGGF